jgi:hypothetical protein
MRTDKFDSEEYGHLVRDLERPGCEHCGELEIGSFVFDDGSTTWCIGCRHTNEPIKPKKLLHELMNEERLSRIEAHTERIHDLENL